MRLIELFFIITLTLWLFAPLAYFLLIRFTLDVKLTARNKVSNRNNCKRPKWSSRERSS